jgi:hypothetical protein
MIFMSSVRFVSIDKKSSRVSLPAEKVYKKKKIYFRLPLVNESTNTYHYNDFEKFL